MISKTMIAATFAILAAAMGATAASAAPVYRDGPAWSAQSFGDSYMAPRSNPENTNGF